MRRRPDARIRVVFLGTPEFAVPTLRALADAPDFAIALVVTQPDRPAGRGRRLTPSPVKRFALERGLPVLQPERPRGAAVLERLRQTGADLFTIAAYGQLLRPAVLALPPHGCLNVHPSLLPRHRGPAPIPATILAGDRETGVTIMLTDAGMDTGPILQQEQAALRGDETAAELTDRLAALGARLLPATARDWVAGRLTPQPQDDALATVSRLLTKDDGALDWRQPASALARQIRALNPWPRAFTFAGDRRLLLLHAVEADDQARTRNEHPGTILGVDDVAFLVATGQGVVRVTRAQLAGRAETSGAALLRQGQLAVGQVLGPPPSGRVSGEWR